MQDQLNLDAVISQLLAETGLKCPTCGAAGWKTDDLKPTPHMVYMNIMKATADFHKVTFAEIMGRGRTKDIVVARHTGWSILHSTGLSYAHIARLVSRDHSSVMWGIKKHRKKEHWSG